MYDRPAPPVIHGASGAVFAVGASGTVLERTADARVDAGIEAGADAGTGDGG